MWHSLKTFTKAKLKLFYKRSASIFAQHILPTAFLGCYWNKMAAVTISPGWDRRWHWSAVLLVSRLPSYILNILEQICILCIHILYSGLGLFFSLPRLLARPRGMVWRSQWKNSIYNPKPYMLLCSCEWWGVKAYQSSTPHHQAPCR